MPISQKVRKVVMRPLQGCEPKRFAEMTRSWLSGSATNTGIILL